MDSVFTFSMTVDFGNFEDNAIGTAAQLLQLSGTGRLSPEDLKKEWYKLGTDFGIGASDNETTVTLTGLDENFDASVALMMELLTAPKADPGTLDKLKQIILVQRADAKKQAPNIANALVQYNRYGKDSYYLRMIPDAGIEALTEEQLFAVIKKLLTYKHTFGYTGSLSMDAVMQTLDKYKPADSAPLEDPPPYRYLKARTPPTNEIYFFNKEMAQSHVRLEFGSVDYDESLMPAIQLYNSYFAGGMAGVVFQELRESRALAYVAGAQYVTGYRKDDENLMVGVIQTQADKTSEAADAFAEILDTLPVSQDRFATAQDSLINQYRTGKIGFRDIIGAVRTWARHGLEPDPRAARFEAIQTDTLDTVVQFQKVYISGKPKLISIVGDESKIDMDKLKALGPIKEIPLGDIFVN
jgi:predicted Zn-dependent peptidase